MRFPTDTETRIAFAQAAEVARELGHHSIGPDHLVLGLLTNVRGRAFAALAEHDITYDDAHERVVAWHTAHPSDPQETAYDAERRALARLGLDLDQVRTAVQQTFGEDITEGWGERNERRRHGGRGGGRGGRGGRGRRGPRSERLGPMSPELREILASLRPPREPREPDQSGERGQSRERDESHKRGHDRPRRRRGRGSRLVAAVLTSESPAVDAALGGLSRQAREQIAASLTAEVEATPAS